ncbi:hypothetical protein NX059_007254 [Plenodomus lindquistii]|nr:hypothetical protein NX059_007254 [Plenodomus lindquistii]
MALGVRYVTLSYVWGQSPMFKLQKSNLRQLSQEGSLRNIIEHLPNTIKNAIELVSSMGERYLWVDSLCLVQDDADDVALGISMMNMIYRDSYCTIVAGSGVDAGAGLAGLHTSSATDIRRVLTTRQVSPGLTMTIIHSVDWHLSRSVYNERGWTLQELVLSRRTVIFIDGQIYFRCQEANWSEDTWSDEFHCWLDTDDSNISRMPTFMDGVLPSLWAYQKLCEDFSRRKLRDDGDALRAFAGVIRPMTVSMDTSMTEGLPDLYLDHFLLFMATKGDLRRRDRFASFSWAGWEGAIIFPRENYVTYEHKADGTLKGVRETSHIFQYLKRGRIVDWSWIDIAGKTASVSLQWYNQPTIQKFLDRFSTVFSPEKRDKEALDKSHSDQLAQYSISSGSTRGIPSSIDTATEFKGDRFKRFNGAAFNLAHSELEFQWLLSRLENKSVMQRMLSNWLAQRRFNLREFDPSELAVRPRPRREAYVYLDNYRPLRKMHKKGGEVGEAWDDHRMRRYRLYNEERSAFAESAQDFPAVPYVHLNLHKT